VRLQRSPPSPLECVEPELRTTGVTGRLEDNRARCCSNRRLAGVPLLKQAWADRAAVAWVGPACLPAESLCGSTCARSSRAQIACDRTQSARITVFRNRRLT